MGKPDFYILSGAALPIGGIYLGLLYNLPALYIISVVGFARLINGMFLKNEED